MERPAYEQECARFIADAIGGHHWQIWVAEVDGAVVAQVFVALVEKVPRPVREHCRIAYLTNVYTLPAFRGRGLGHRLVRHAQEAARAADAELMLVWPSEDSADFYGRLGFEAEREPLVWHADRNAD